MPHVTSSGKYVDSITSGPAAVPVVVSATVNGVAQETAEKHRALVTIVASAPTSSPNVTTKLQTSNDNSTWRDLIPTTAAFVAQTGANTQSANYAGLDRWIRLVYTFSGTGTLTVTPSLELV